MREYIERPKYIHTMGDRVVNTLVDVFDERVSQDEKWGVQEHDDYVWNAILGEEVGEVAQALIDHEFKGTDHKDVRAELVQVAAVAVAWIEAIDRRAAL